MKKKSKENFLGRFSSFLVGSGKKISGHKILMESLFCLRQNNNHNALICLQTNTMCSNKNQFEKDKKFGLQNKDMQNLTHHKEALHFKEKVIRQFLSSPCISFFTDAYKNEILSTCRYTQQFEKTQEKKISREKGQQYNQITNPGNNIENNSELYTIRRLYNQNLCLDSVENTKPILETRKVRKGRVTYKVPKVTSSIRQEGKAISLLIENANLRKRNKRSGSFIDDSVQNKVSSEGNRTNISMPTTTFGVPTQEKKPQIYHDSAKREKTQNRVDFSLPFFFSSQIAKAETAKVITALESSVKTSFSSTFDSIFLIMPSGYQSFDKDNMPQEKKHPVRKNLFFLDKEKKIFLTNFQKPSIEYCLSEEFFDSANGKGGSIEKKKQLHNIALQNRAYQHFRWW